MDIASIRNEIAEKALMEFEDLNCETLKPFVPFMMLKGKPLTFDLHFPLLPFFKMRRPRQTVFVAGRQVGKSASLSASCILRGRMIPDYDMLCVQPRFEQIKRFSGNYVEKMIKTSPFQDFLTSGNRKSSLMERPVGESSNIFFAHAFLSPDSSRGHSVAELNIDEVQDINVDFIPILGETLSAQVEHGYEVYSGTPKALDNTLNLLFEQSSMAFAHIRCDACNFENIASEDYHLMQMIGKRTCICAKCGRKLNLRNMEYVHHRPEMRSKCEGYHISQVTHPLHADYEEKWAILVNKMESPNYSEITFKNEVLGIAASNNDKPLTEAQLKEASLPEIDNTIATAKKWRKGATMAVLGVDWSGFGKDQTSTTVASLVLALPGTSELKCVFAVRLPTGLDPTKEAKELLKLFEEFKCDYFAHDYSGAGTIRETVMVHSGLPAAKIIPFDIVSAPVRPNIIQYYKPPTGGRSCYSIDKTRALMVLYQAIKAGQLKLPNYNNCKEITSDFLNVNIETKENPRGRDFVFFERILGRTDDCIHSVNFACSTIWHAQGAYPKLAPTMTEEERLEVEGH
jgi:hypothetical protein